jgi:hypothetical protein
LFAINCSRISRFCWEFSLFALRFKYDNSKRMEIGFKMATISRTHGQVSAGAFYGLQPIILKIAGTGVGTGDTVNATTGVITDGNFTKSIRAIQRIASIVYIGSRADNQFVVIIDGATANPYVSANTDTDVAAAIDAVVTAAHNVSTTVTDITGLTAGTLA